MGFLCAHEFRVRTHPACCRARKYEAEAFDWATAHLRWQYSVRQDTTYSLWPSTRGAELLALAGLLRTVLDDCNATRASEDMFVSATLETLRALRAAAVEDNIGELDDVLANRPGLSEDFMGLFAALLP